MLLLLASCRLPYAPVPESYEAIRGEHCIVLMTRQDISRDQYRAIAAQADKAYEDVVRLMELDFSAIILITYDPLSDRHYGYKSRAYAAGTTVYLSEEFFSSPLPEMRLVLRHEITHLVAGIYLGITDSFLLSEGLAVYIENRRQIKVPSFMKDQIEEVLDLSYMEYFLYVFDNLSLSRSYYELSGEFVEYWCETFGLSNFYALYREANSANYRQMIERYGGQPFSQIMEGFKQE